MLLRFSIQNYSSIAEKQEFFLVATKLRDEPSHLIKVSASDDIQALPVALIYGANASGKTNFLKAMGFMRDAVLLSHSMSRKKDYIPRECFALDDDFIKSPTEIEMDFVIEEIRYTYGFQCNNSHFLKEWLYSFPEGKRRKLFERDAENISFGSFFKGSKKTISGFMKPGSLFVSTASQNEHQSLSKIVDYFYNIQISEGIHVSETSININYDEDKKIDPRTIDFLRDIGTGIVDYSKTEDDFFDNHKELKEDFMSVIKKHLVTDDEKIKLLNQMKNYQIKFSHLGKEGKKYDLSLSCESAGTKRLVLILHKVFSAIDSGSVVLIDEIDASLHTHVSEKIIEIFNNKEINKLGAQLIATTHDTNVLNSKLLRRDQIWFCEKNLEGKSNIYSLSDIKTRSNDDFEKRYLDGRYGSIPYSGNIKELINKD